MKKIFIYSLKHPITDEVRYIGRTVNLKRRYKQHLNDNKRSDHKSTWIKSLLKDNLKPTLDVLEECDDVTWEDREIYWITQFDNLTNYQKGGYGGSDYIRVTKEETCNKLSEARRKVILTDKWKDNIGKTLGFSCIINDVEYRSIKQAGIELGVSARYIKRRILSDDYPEYKFK